MDIIFHCLTDLTECYSNLTIINITKQFNGRINCSNVYRKQRFKIEKKAIRPVKVERKYFLKTIRLISLLVLYGNAVYNNNQLSNCHTEPQFPVIQNASGLNMTRISGQSVQWWCFVQGMPPPTVTWFKVSTTCRRRSTESHANEF